MFDKILIANRGEIACRVARTARRLGMRTVAVYSDADADALHVAACDEAYASARRRRARATSTATRSSPPRRRPARRRSIPATASCPRTRTSPPPAPTAGVVFIGPPPAAIARDGHRSRRPRRSWATAGVPLVPGYHGDDQDPALLAREAARDRLSGADQGGGRRRRQGHARSSTRPRTSPRRSRRRSARRRRASATTRVLVERYSTAPRHIEIQVFADTHGDAVYLFERDCSVQRRHQKVLEEAPAPGMTAERRARDGRGRGRRGARRSATSAPAPSSSSPSRTAAFYFMEMNTRLQVEHPVTEMITGLDLVEWQLRVAAGEPLPLRAGRSSRSAATRSRRASTPRIPTAASCRRPARSRTCVPPRDRAGVRVDTGVRAGDAITPYYDPMIAKLIVWGEDRAKALRAAARGAGRLRDRRRRDQRRVPARAGRRARRVRRRRTSTPA